MNIKELRELDAWIAENVFEYSLAYGEICTIEPDKNGEPDIKEHKPIPNYTTDPAAAMEVLKKCLVKSVPTVFHAGSYWLSVFGAGNSLTPLWSGDEAKTLELAICLFAKQLFTK